MWPFCRKFIVEGEIILGEGCWYAIRLDDGTVLQAQIERSFRVAYGQRVRATCTKFSRPYDIAVDELQVIGEDVIPQILRPALFWGKNKWHTITGNLLDDGINGFIVPVDWGEHWSVTLRPVQKILVNNHVRIRGRKLGRLQILAEEITLLG